MPLAWDNFSELFSTLDFDRSCGDTVSLLESIVTGHRLAVYSNQVIFRITVGKFLAKETLNRGSLINIDIIRETTADKGKDL